MQAKTVQLFQRIDSAEFALCLRLNKLGKFDLIRSFFKVVSRLGDGVYWYILMLLLPVVFGTLGLKAALHMTVVGLIGVMIYKVLKKNLVRERPYISHPDILAGTAPLDKYSFPSGHTLHAVCFSAVFYQYFPELWFVSIPFAVCVAISRVVLGLHYPTDVLAGAVLGAVLAFSSTLFV